MSKEKPPFNHISTLMKQPTRSSSASQFPTRSCKWAGQLKRQYFGHLVWRANSLEKTLRLGKIEGQRRGQQRMRRWDSTTDSINRHESEQTRGDSEGQWSLVCCSPWGHKELDMNSWLNNNNNKGPFQDRLFPNILFFSSSLKYINNGMWYTFWESLYTC